MLASAAAFCSIATAGGLVDEVDLALSGRKRSWRCKHGGS